MRQNNETYKHVEITIFDNTLKIKDQILKCLKKKIIVKIKTAN